MAQKLRPKKMEKYRDKIITQSQTQMVKQICNAVADPGFPRGGGADIRFCLIFPKITWNWKNLDPRGGGGASLAAPLDSPLQCTKCFITWFLYCGSRFLGAIEKVQQSKKKHTPGKKCMSKNQPGAFCFKKKSQIDYAVNTMYCVQGLYTPNYL